MQGIILCPKCRVRVKKDNLGELSCPNCNARLCPKAHIFDGKICPYCGWEDPNYQLWQQAQKARQQTSAAKKVDKSPQGKLQYTCPNCGTSVDAVHKDCPSCGFLGAKYRSTSAAPTGAVTTAARPVVPAAPSFQPKMEGISPTRSPLLKEIAKAKRREWKFPQLGHFVRPVLASLLVGIVLSGLVLGGIHITRFFSQSAEPGTQSLHLSLTSSKTYTLGTNVIPEAGGEIKIVSPLSSSGTFEPGSKITLMAIPDDCYTFSYWDGASGSSETAVIIMDSNKSVTAHFRLKDTTPPTILEVKVVSYSDVSATIAWETEETATSQVEYGKTRDYGQTAESTGEPAISHKVHLIGLEPSTTYYFMVKSADKCGNVASGADMLQTLSEIPAGDRVGRRASDFELQEYQDDDSKSPNNGETVKLSQFRGKKILLNFWNTFCGACLAEFPLIREVYEDEKWANENLSPEFVIITVCIDGRADRIAKLEDKYIDKIGEFTFPILLDTEVNPANSSYHVDYTPKTVFIDSDGIIRKIKTGRFENTEEITGILRSLD
ncbi:MAG: redoxin domain-containing protein [Chloroflexi bacterium]|nr:redoxin domain-containing protein [Chloroflexota bacterium]